MSKMSSIDIKLISENSLRVIDIVKKLNEFGWSLNDNGRVSFLPLGDKDDFNWTRQGLSNKELFDILIQKEIQHEIIGIVMTWKNTDIGGEFLFWIDGNISVILNINKKMIYKEIVDVNWYLSKLIPPLSKWV